MDPVDVSAPISEFRTQMDIIRKASAVVDNIIAKFESINFVPFHPPTTVPPVKRKNTEILTPEMSKKLCIPPVLVPSHSPVISNIDVITSTKTLIDTSKEQTKPSSEFEFAAVKPLKKVFVSRLPAEINVDILKRHILQRLPNCIECLNISILSKRENADYSSAIITVGRNDDFFNVINNKHFWPPETVVHQHRTHRKNQGFRPKSRNTWARR